MSKKGTFSLPETILFDAYGFILKYQNQSQCTWANAFNRNNAMGQLALLVKYTQQNR